MYKLAYRHSIHDAIKHTTPHHLDENLEDLATLIFGRVGDTPERCLKGRVTFQHAVAEGTPSPSQQPITILNGPKPTYYPNYIRQPKAAGDHIPEQVGYSTLMDDACEIRGWKRYPARPLAQAAVQGVTGDQVGNTAVQIRLHTLPGGTTFRTRMSFHNLKSEELGALCWAITWAGADGLRHGLGMGKPFGFGQIDIAIDEQTSQLRPNSTESKPAIAWKDSRKAFIEYMEKAGKNHKGWKNSPQISALLGMADPAKRPLKGELHHMQLSTEQLNQFKDAKTGRLVLSEYAKGTHPSASIQSGGGDGDTSLDWSGVEIKLNPGSGELSISHQGKTASVRNPDAQRLRDTLPSDIKDRLKTRRFLRNCRVRVVSVGNALILKTILAVGEVVIAPDTDQT